MAMRWGWIVGLAALLAACDENKPEPSAYDGAVVVKICVDGTRIYRLLDGRFVTGGLGLSFVDNPETVCATR